MSAFEDFVNLELPKRPVMLTLGNTGFDGDPNGGGVPAVIANSPQGTFFFRQTGEILYIKESSSPGTWSTVGSGGGSEQTAALQWNITTAGNDTTGDGSVGAPFATPAGALAKFRALYGTRVRYLVDFLIGPGNFPGFNVQGWEMDPAVTSPPVGFRFIGSWTVVDSGTFTTVTTGNTTADIVYSKVADSTKTWTVNQHKARFIRVNTGTSALQILPIFSNTATEVVVPLVTAFGSVGGTYDIVEPATVINTAANIPPGVVAANAANQTPTPLTNGIGVFLNKMLPSSAMIRFENIDIAPATCTFGVNIQGDPATFSRCRSKPVALTSAAVNINGGFGAASFSQGVANPPSNQIAVNVAGTGQVTLTQDLIYSTGGSSSTSINVSIFGTLSATLCMLEPASFGIPVTGQGVLTLSNTTITGGGAGVSQLIRSRVVEGNSGSLFLFASALVLKDNPASTGLEIQGPAFASITALFASGSLYGVAVSQGGKVKLGPTSTVSSVGGLNDIILDDFTAPTTLANMRAQTPKVLTNSYGTALWE